MDISHIWIPYEFITIIIHYYSQLSGFLKNLSKRLEHLTGVVEKSKISNVKKEEYVKNQQFY
jgi:hypothetical protein